MNTMNTSVAVITTVIVLAGGVFLLTKSGGGVPQPVNADNVQIVDGIQIVEITAKGGYMPRTSVAKAGIPTVIRFKTEGTFDCSSSVRIPSMNISKFLPQTGSTDVDIGEGKLGTLQGSCGMGMYPFEVEFQG